MSDRYVVFEVGCIECIGGGRSEPEVIMTTDALDDALASFAVTFKQYDADRFVFDTVSMSMARVSHSESE